jgi:hypothetical protein
MNCNALLLLYGMMTRYKSTDLWDELWDLHRLQLVTATRASSLSVSASTLD